MVFQLAIIGDPCVGKTTYKYYLKEQEKFNFLKKQSHFPTNYSSNFNNNFETIKVLDNQISILDAPGQELFLQQTEKLLYCCDGVIILYDKSNEQSKKHVLSVYIPIIEKINLNRRKKIKVSIIGNKDDIGGGRNTFRNSNFRNFDTEIYIFSMSLRNESIVFHENAFFWREKNIDLLTPLKKII